MNIENRFELLVAVVFYMSPQLGGIGPKAQDLVILFRFGEGKSLQSFHLKNIQAQSEIYLLNDETGQTNKLTR